MSELLEEFNWIKNYDLVDFTELEDSEIIWEIRPEFDDEGNLIDLAGIAGSSYIRLSEEPDWWPFENMRTGNWVAEC